MKRVITKVMTLVCSSVFILAITTINSVSRHHAYQGQFPNELKKYKK